MKVLIWCEISQSKSDFLVCFFFVTMQASYIFGCYEKCMGWLSMCNGEWRKSWTVVELYMPFIYILWQWPWQLFYFLQILSPSAFWRGVAMAWFGSGYQTIHRPGRRELRTIIDLPAPSPLIPDSVTQLILYQHKLCSKWSHLWLYVLCICAHCSMLLCSKVQSKICSIIGMDQICIAALLT